MSVTTVHLAVMDGIADWEYGHVTAMVNASPYRADSSWVVRTVGLTRQPVTTMGGLRVTPDLSVDELHPAQSALLLLPGGDWIGPVVDPFLEAARAFLAAGVPVAAICGATFGLARAGLLDGRRHTSNAREFLQASGYQGAAGYVDEAAVTDGDLITASGLAPVPFAQEILNRLGVCRPEAVDTWVKLNETRDPVYFFELEASAGEQ